MFQMFGFGGIKCPRCERKSAGDSGYCSHCGMTLGAPRNPVVLRENRWIPADNELAVFFGVSALSGLFVKTLHVPATTRAYILQGDKATEVPQGEYEIEGFFTRLNHLLRDDHAEILITRTAPLPLHFQLDALQTAEYLEVKATLDVSIKVENLAAFGRYFMTTPGAVTTAHLEELLAPMVRQLAAEFVASQSIREMCHNRDLRPQLDERLQSALRQQLAQFGLAVVEVQTLDLRHEAFDANRARIGTLWLAADERRVKLEHSKQLGEIYNDEQWQRIELEEQERRLRYRRAEMRSDERVDNLDLTMHEAERVQAMRAREIDLYGRIVESKNRKQALDKGAADVLAALEHDLAKKNAARGGEAMQWEHVRQVAAVRMQAELEAARQDGQHTRMLAQQRFSHQLLQQQIRNKMEQALAIEDEARQRDALRRLHASEQAEHARAAELVAEQHRAALDSLTLANDARRRAAEREQAWEDQLAQERQRELLRTDQRKDMQAQADVEQVRQQLEALRRDGAQQDAIAQHEKLLRTIEADGRHTRQEQQAALETQQAHWQHELARLNTIAAMDDMAKLALVAAPNAEVLADVLKTRIYKDMAADQLTALAGMAGGGNHGQARCANGHPAEATEQCCATCGAPLQ